MHSLWTGTARPNRERPDAERRGRSADRDAGSLVPLVAVVSVALFLVIGLAVDGGSALVSDRSAYQIAEQAARAGAAQLSVSDLRSSGVLSIDSRRAIVAAQSYAVAAGHAAAVSVSGDRVRVTISYREPTAVLSIIGITHIDVSAAASATNVSGISGGLS